MTLKPWRVALFLFFCWGQSYCLAQDKSNIEFGKVSPADFNLPVSPIIDSNTNAVILSDAGSIHFIGNSNNWFSNVYQRRTRIKILNKKAFDDLATVHIWLYKPADDPEMLDKLSASTYNLENGQVVETKLDKKSFFEDRQNKEFVIDKFTLPAVKEGSIIEYTYTITSKYNVDLPSWRFQSRKYPCLRSELQVDVPQALFYVLVKQGVHAYAVDKGGTGDETYRMEGKDGGSPMIVNATTVKHQWVMKDIPAFHGEEFLSSPENYLDKIDFQLSKTYNGEEYRDYMNSWKQATGQLLERENFGATLDEDNSLVANVVAKAVEGSSGYLEEARAIYYYMCHHFTCDNHDDMYLKTTLSDVVKKNGGTVGDINLLLVAMLRRIGLKADPVVLSTRDYGFNLASYPVLRRLNYVIARLLIDDKVYYLDAARPQLGFGQLDDDCYNGHARIISKTDSGSVFFLPDSLKERKTTMVYLAETEKGTEGVWESTLGQQGSYELRQRVTEKGEKEYFKNIQTQYGEDLDISNGGIDSLDKPEDPVKVHYEFRLHQDDGGAKRYLNPFVLGDGMRTNPFKAAERKYPVEMPYATDELYVFTMQLPEGYLVEELPKSARAALNGDQGFFEYLIGEQAGVVQLRCHLKLNKANFTPDDYNSLRDFFTLIVKKEGESIVLKKK
jgi:hypothetical protein